MRCARSNEAAGVMGGKSFIAVVEEVANFLFLARLGVSQKTVCDGQK